MELYEKVEKIINTHLSPDYDFDDIMIGHSYFLANNDEELKMKFEYEIKPLLLEYYKDGILVDKEEKVIDKIKELALN